MVICTDFVVVPPRPVQARVNVEADERLPVLAVPLSAFPPAHAPEATQVVAPWLDQVRLALLPEATWDTSDVRVNVGAAGGVPTLMA